LFALAYELVEVTALYPNTCRHLPSALRQIKDCIHTHHTLLVPAGAGTSTTTMTTSFFREAFIRIRLGFAAKAFVLS
jgi:hypothetical protein